MVSGKMGAGLGVSSWLLIAITIIVVLQLFSMAGVSGAQMSHQLHGNCLKVLNVTMTCWGWSTQLCDQNDLFECLVVPSRKLQQVPTSPVPTNSPPHAREGTPGPPE
ncbi:unnamed protein product [Sphagnum balticum]